MGLETSQRSPKLRGYPLRSILDQFWTRFWEGPEVEFKEAYASKIASETIWHRFDTDFEAILECLRALS